MKCLEKPCAMEDPKSESLIFMNALEPFTGVLENYAELTSLALVVHKL